QEQVHARQIQVASREQAQQALDKLQQGQKFEDVAKSMSTDGASKDKGGDMGWLTRGIESVPWDEAAFALQAGQRSGIVQVPARGFVVIEVLERDPNRPLSKEQLDQLRGDAYQKWLTSA